LLFDLISKAHEKHKDNIIYIKDNYIIN